MPFKALNRRVFLHFTSPKFRGGRAIDGDEESNQEGAFSRELSFGGDSAVKEFYPWRIHNFRGANTGEGYLWDFWILRSILSGRPWLI